MAELDFSWEDIGGKSSASTAQIINVANREDTVIKPVTNHVGVRRQAREAGLHLVQKEISRFHHEIREQLTTRPGETLVFGASREGLPSDAGQLTSEVTGSSRADDIVLKGLFPKAEGHAEVESARAEEGEEQEGAALSAEGAST
ncbi:hypothetical protein GNI_022010 [Gregarina niphandrodes]|uniref:Uncharacterized protein n=1 Tax=Gregarina niphandrodes TaxID=110365 RepID=A0A023BBP2_GRENI|nr:hypothetical protein GNI_022010 [Gregarina niphandrodes]EZG80258.1 hypothetical protein GNI_022010 [Gregarina niphandrodes]|eukprot:XP_011134312.1 hypothetical protein GNI_022010 [Gregarina niphandrodes]